jgi:hypothetical protein
MVHLVIVNSPIICHSSAKLSSARDGDVEQQNYCLLVAAVLLLPLMLKDDSKLVYILAEVWNTVYVLVACSVVKWMNMNIFMKLLD